MMHSRVSQKNFLITVSISFLVISLILFGAITPLFLRVRASSEGLKQLIGERVNAIAQFKQRQERAQDVIAAQDSIHRLSAFFSRNDLRDLSVVYDQLERLAATQGVTFTAPIAEAGSEKDRAILVFPVQGSFAQVMSFLKRLEQFPRFSRVDGTSLGSKTAPGAQGEVSMHIAGTITFSLFLLP